METYKELSITPEFKKSEILIPGIFVETEAIKDGDWTIVGNEPVDSTKIEFPEAIIRSNNVICFTKGEIQIELPVHSDYYEDFPVRPCTNNSFQLADISQYYVDNPRVDSKNEGPL